MHFAGIYRLRLPGELDSDDDYLRGFDTYFISIFSLHLPHRRRSGCQYAQKTRRLVKRLYHTTNLSPTYYYYYRP